MRIKSINIENNSILGNIFLKFTDINNEIINTIIIAGENGTGKSTILNMIYEFSNFKIRSVPSKEKRTIMIQLSENDIERLNAWKNYKVYFPNGILNNELQFNFDFSILDWGQCNVTYKDSLNNEATVGGDIFTLDDLKPCFKTMFSDTEINFGSQSINSVTSKNIDEDNKKSVKSSPALAAEITQLLVDIQALDDGDFMQWSRNHLNEFVNTDMMDIRMKRFKEAFDFMFKNKRYKAVRNENNTKKVIFEEFGNEMEIDCLSSGEKQIVFRGSFLLKDQKSNNGCLILIDEPELSLHPNWQIDILDFYKKLFTDNNGVQTSQMFFVTHSPFIIHNQNRNNDKVIILKRDENGNIYIPKNGGFNNWTKEEIVEKAFNINEMRSEISSIKKNLIITEGKTDWKHLKSALNKFRKEGKFTENSFQFLEFGNELTMGGPKLITTCEQLSIIPNDYKIICIFDRDVSDTLKKVECEGKKFKEWNNNVFSFAIPVPPHRASTPDICIEHYYLDGDLKLKNGEGRRLFLGNEFSQRTGVHIEYDKVCRKKDMCGGASIKIIDSEVFMIENENANIAISKNQFASNILDETEPFDKVNYSSFEEVFNIIYGIISN